MVGMVGSVWTRFGYGVVYLGICGFKHGSNLKQEAVWDFRPS